MGSVVISGATSGAVTLAVPAEAGTRTLTLPATTGTVLTNDISAAGDTSAGDAAAVGYTSAEGLILTGQGSASDVTLKNDADGTALSIPTGTTNVTVVGNIAVGGTVDGRDIATDGTKLDTIAPNATGTQTTVSGSSGSCTGNSATATTATNVSGGSVSATSGNFSGLIVGKVSNVNTIAGSNDSGSISIRGNTSYPAAMSFHRAGAYAINFGLSTANKMELGGWSAGAIKHTWDMSGNYTAVGNITAYSDERVKTNIEKIPNALDKISKLNGYTFDRTDFTPDAETGVMPNTRQTGVIAQEVLKVLPEAVILGDTPEDTMSVAYGNMVGLMVEAIKELEARVKELENK